MSPLLDGHHAALNALAVNSFLLRPVSELGRGSFEEMPYLMQQRFHVERLAKSRVCPCGRHQRQVARNDNDFYVGLFLSQPVTSAPPSISPGIRMSVMTSPTFDFRIQDGKRIVAIRRL